MEKKYLQNVMTHFQKFTFWLKIKDLLTQQRNMIRQEQFHLEWNDFQKGIVSTYQELRNKQDFSDVTLVCEDNQRMRAHKLILSNSCEFFRAVLAEEQSSQPVIYMRGVSRDVMESLVDFIYRGEVSIPQDLINEFLDLAGDLKMKGLVKNESDENAKKDDIAEDGDGEDGQKKTRMKSSRLQRPQNQNISEEEELDLNSTELESKIDDEGIVSESNFKERRVSVSFGEKNEELKEKIQLLIEKRENQWACIACDRMSKSPADARRHAEIHISGFVHTCTKCDKTFQTSNSVNMHFYTNHKHKSSNE